MSLGSSGGRLPIASDRVSVVIVAFNSADVLDRCFHALAEAAEALHSGRGIETEVVLIDNNSESPARVPDVGLPIEVLRLEENVGFAPAANIGAQHGRHSRLILFLNPDTALDRLALVELAGALDDPVTAIAGPLLVTEDDAPSLSERPFHSLRRELRTQLLPLPRRPAYGAKQFETGLGRCLSGACLLVARDFFDLVGGLDTTVRMYLEDVELCWLAHKHGRAVRFVRSARCIHGLGAGSGGANFESKLDLHLTLLGARVEFIRRRSGPGAAAAMRAIIGIGALLRLGPSVIRRSTGWHVAVLKWALASGAAPAWPASPKPLSLRSA